MTAKVGWKAAQPAVSLLASSLLLNYGFGMAVRPDPDDNLLTVLIWAYFLSSAFTAWLLHPLLADQKWPAGLAVVLAGTVAALGPLVLVFGGSYLAWLAVFSWR